jgi:hypothetical protein
VIALLLAVACRLNSDCSVAIERTCCNCQILAVHSKREPRRWPEACDCGDDGVLQGISPDSKCGPLPPDPASLRAVCIEKKCEAVPRKKK